MKENSELLPIHEITINDVRISEVSTADLKKELARGLEITVRHLQHLALIWRELEYRGEDLSDLRHGLMNYLPLISFQKVDARLVVHYAGQKTLLARITRLPIEKQREIAEHGYVTVVTIDSNDQKREIQKPIASLRASEIYQVFTEDGIRNADQQYKLLTTQAVRKELSKKEGPRKARRVKIDKEHKILMVGSAAADIDRVMQQLSEYYGKDLLAFAEEK